MSVCLDVLQASTFTFLHTSQTPVCSRCAFRREDGNVRKGAENTKISEDISANFPEESPDGQNYVNSASEDLTCAAGEELDGSICVAITCDAEEELVGGTCGALDLILDDVSEAGFNPSNTLFSVTTGYFVFVRAPSDTDIYVTEVSGLTDTINRVVVPGLDTGVHTFTVVAATSSVSSVMRTLSLAFGSIVMPVQIVGSDGIPAAGAEVIVSTGKIPGVSQTRTTDQAGLVIFENLTETIMVILAESPSKEMCHKSVAATTSTVTIQLNEFKPAREVGTLDHRPGRLAPATLTSPFVAPS